MIYYISGPTNLTNTQFLIQYSKPILKILNNNPNCKFITSDDNGTCKMFTDFLYKYFLNKHIQPHIIKQRATIYHCGNSPSHNPGFKTIGGFKSIKTRDQIMLNHSDLKL
jgi:hypothetical protein